MIEDNHDERGHHGIHKVERRGRARRHVIVSVDEEQRRTVGEESQIRERHEFAARNLETPFHRHHHHGYDERGEDEAVEENGGIAQVVGGRAFLHGNGEEGNKAVAYGGYQTENNTFYV